MSQVEEWYVSPSDALHHRGQSRVVGRCRHQMEVVRHQRIGMDCDVAANGLVSNKLQEESIVGVLDEHSALVVAALYDMLRHAGNVDAGTPSHATSSRNSRSHQDSREFAEVFSARRR